jgi:hypothetical protein
MSRKPEPLEEWMVDAIQLMIRENLSLRQAALQLEKQITPQQADNIAGRVRFQDALEEARLDYYAEIGSNPKLTKEAVVGQIYQLASRLAADREDFKAADALLKLAKVQGWVGAEPDSSWKVFSNLSQSNIDAVKESLRKQLEQAPSPSVTARAESKEVN